MLMFMMILVPLGLLTTLDNKFLQMSFMLWGTMVFLLILIVYNNSPFLLFQYFLLQEFSGFHYLLGFSIFLQFMILLLKGGLSPFFYWTIFMGIKLSKLSFSWFISIQKLFVLVLISLIVTGFVLFFLFLSLFLVYLIYWLNYNYKVLLLLSSVESVGWLLMFLKNSFLSVLFIFLYLAMVYFFSTSQLNMDFLLALMSFPFSAPFLIKFISMTSVSFMSNFFQVVLMGATFISVLSMSVVLLLFVMYTGKSSTMSFTSFFVLLLPLTLILYFG